MIAKAELPIECDNPLCMAKGRVVLMPTQDKGEWSLRIVEWDITHISSCPAYKNEP